MNQRYKTTNQSLTLYYLLSHEFPKLLHCEREHLDKYIDLENVRHMFKSETLLSDFSMKCNVFLLFREV